MKTVDALLGDLRFAEVGTAVDSVHARACAEAALSEFLSAAIAGDIEELRRLAEVIFRRVPPQSDTSSASAWIAVLEVLGRASQRLYELTAPRQEAVSVLSSDLAQRAFWSIVNSHVPIQASELRRQLGIENQANLSRIIRKLVQGELVAVEHDRANAAWYRATLAGRRFAYERAVSGIVARPREETQTPPVPPRSKMFADLPRRDDVMVAGMTS